ncbi:MAG: stage II sporulation protein R [Eubacteriales bacterium]|nr:stage II sporulation protein R [Eubacteriales bacterium]
MTAMIFLFVLILCACAKTTPFRLHIIANSDSAEDQQVKLVVRDAVLEITKDGMENCDNAEQAEEYITENIEIILKTANDTLIENGFGYAATATVGTCYFPEKSYQDITYPEGDYQALKVILGDGEGQNWWCVMFPPLCITEIEGGEEDIEYTSFLAELFASLFGE